MKVVFFFIGAFFHLFTCIAQILEIDRSFDVSFDGDIRQIKRDSNTIFVAGSFTQAGILRPYASALNDQGTSVKGFPRFDGYISAIEEDGAGGWYMAGNFDYVGDSLRPGLVHLDQFYKVTSFNPGWSKGIVSLHLSNNRLYAGGYYDVIGGTSKRNLALLDYASNSLYFPEPNGVISSAIPDGSGGWFLSGIFNKLQDSIRSDIAHVNKEGIITSWSPSLAGGIAKVIIPWGEDIILGGIFNSVNGNVRQNLALVDRYGELKNWTCNTNGEIHDAIVIGNSLFIGGSFTSVNSEARNNFAEIDLLTGQVTDLDINVNGSVYCMELGGNAIFFGGEFTQVNNLSRQNLASLDLSTGVLGDWNPGANGRVRDLKIKDGLLYLGGQFTVLGLQQRNFLGAVTEFGQVTDWNPNPNNWVYSIDVAHNSVFLGGSFTRINNIERSFIASVNILSGLVDDFECNTNSWVTTVAVANDKVLIAGGFSAIQLKPRKGFATLNSLTGELLEFRSDFNSTVASIQTANNNIFIGGNFTKHNDDDVSYLVVLDESTGQRVLAPTLSGNIFTLKSIGNRMLVGGTFNQVEDQNRNYLAVFNTSNLNLENWSPDFNFPVVNISCDNENIYVSGFFSSVNGQPRSSVASFTINDLILTNWAPKVDGYVYTVLPKAEKIYLAGSFVRINETNRNNIAVVEKDSDSLLEWNPNANLEVNELIFTNEGYVIAGGMFNYIGLEPRAGVAAIDIPTGELKPWHPKVNGSVNAIEVSASDVFIGGSFSVVNGFSRSNFASIKKIDGSVNSFSPSFNGQIRALHRIGNFLFVSGDFTQTNSQSRRHLASFNLESSSLTNFSPNPNGVPTAMAASGDTLYVGGNFTVFGSSTNRPNLAAFDIKTNQLLSWTVPQFFNGIPTQLNALTIAGQNLVVGGSFNKIGDTDRNNIAAINRTTAQLTDFNPSAFGVVRSVGRSLDKVYVGGDFMNIGGKPRTYLGVLDSFGQATSWRKYIESFIRTLDVDEDYLFIGGRFESIEGVKLNRFAAFRFNEKPKIVLKGNFDRICKGDSIVIPFEIIDENIDQIILAAESSNPFVVKDENILFRSDNLNNYLVVFSGEFIGETLITITAIDEYNQSRSVVIPLSIIDLPEGGMIMGDSVVFESINQARLELYNFSGIIERWEYSVDEGETWKVFQSNSQEIEVVLGAERTFYRAVLSNGICEELSEEFLVKRIVDPEWSVTIYPVPTSSELNIKIIGTNIGPTSIEIYDSKGSVVLTYFVVPEMKHITLESKFLKQGLYLCRVRNNDNLYIGKILFWH